MNVSCAAPPRLALFPALIAIALVAGCDGKDDNPGSPDPGGIPLRFIVKGCIPAGFFLLLLQGISLGIHSLLQILGIETEEGKEA